MTIKYKHLVDGTAFTAAEFNSRLGATVGGINNLSLEDTSLGAFRYNHLPCMIGPAGESEGDLTDSWETDYGGFTGAYSILLHDKTEVRAITSVRAFGDGAGEDPDRIVSCNFKAGDTAGDITGTFPSYVLNSGGYPGPNAVLLLGNINIKTWRLKEGTTYHGDLNEDAMAVEAAFRIRYKKIDGTIEEKVLDKTRRQLSPRLTIGNTPYPNVPNTPARATDGSDLWFAEALIQLNTTADFNTAGHADEGKITLSYLPPGGSQTPFNLASFPDGILMTALNAPGDDTLIFYLDGTGPTPTSTPLGVPTLGALVDKAATLAAYPGSDGNVIKIQPSELSTERTDALNNTTTWVTTSFPNGIEWSIEDTSDSAMGVPFLDDLDTNQDLPIRSVLLFSDLAIDGAEIIRIDLVATQVGGFVGNQFNVFFSKANITAIPIQAKVTT